ncbi:MAG: hypothetical protein K2Y29_07560 [Beijerinckiaceae bacterium]|nr:hypothetical protein [Beijerinckiaceae bacterium]
MENFYFDRARCQNGELEAISSVFAPLIARKHCIVVGSAPLPVFPKHDGYVICVNGSVRAANAHLKVASDLTYLNSAIFRDDDDYARRTRDVLLGTQTHRFLIPIEQKNTVDDLMASLQLNYKTKNLISKYAKRTVMTQLLGHRWNGSYHHRANVSNGVFMVAFALWAGAEKVTMVGFSLQNGHYYNMGSHLSERVHVREDILFLRMAADRNLPISTTSVELHRNVGVKLVHA